MVDIKICYSCTSIYKGKNHKYCNSCKVITSKCNTCFNRHKTRRIDINQCDTCKSLNMNQYIQEQGMKY